MSRVELISVVAPIFNEEHNLHELHRRLTTVLSGLDADYEIILVDDGSKDKSFEVIEELASTDSRLRYIRFSRNFGHQNAIFAGMRGASGSIIIIMDGDLQDPPELIPELIAQYHEGYKVVNARRRSRKGETWFKKASARLFYRLLRRITSVDIPLDTGDFRLISREVLQHLLALPETNRFLRGQIAWLGFKQHFVYYDRDERLHGSTKFSVIKMARFALDGITSFSNLPLQIASLLGLLFSMVAFFIILYALYSKFILQEAITGWTSIIISTMFIGGVQLLSIGVIGEYISRIANDVRRRPDYVIEQSNLSEKQE